MVRVKICGITNLDDAALAVGAGADALGFIFVPNTPRYMTPEQVEPIVRALPPFITPVGVFWDHPLEEVKAIADRCRLGALQFHGDEPPDYVEQFAQKVIKAFRVDEERRLEELARYRVDGYLLDSPGRWSEGERRAIFPWELARRAGDRGWRIILSGGLTPENVEDAIRIARPYGVDVDSGVEARPGKKDPERLRAFLSRAKGTVRGGG